MYRDIQRDREIDERGTETKTQKQVHMEAEGAGRGPGSQFERNAVLDETPSTQVLGAPFTQPTCRLGLCYPQACPRTPGPHSAHGKLLIHKWRCGL